jgi:hypothetical protein
VGSDAPQAVSPKSQRGPQTRWAPVLRWAPLAFALAVLAYHLAPIWREPSTWASWWDCRYFFFMVEVDHTTIAQHHQLPLWNPYYCGGAPHLANPQASPLSPLTPLILAFGLPIGYRLGYTVGRLTALLSMRAYAPTLGLSEVASAVAGAGFGVSGALTMHMAGGHWSWMGFALYPLLLRSLTLAVDGRRAHVVWGALVFAIIVFHSPIYPMAFAFVTLGFHGLYLGLRDGPRDRARLRRAVVAVAATLALGLALGGLRILPMGEFIAAHPRAVKDWDYTWPWELVVTYAVRHGERAFGAHQYVFPEYGNYFGFVGVALMLAGLGLVLRRRRALWPLIAAAVTLVLFQLGNLVPMPWWLLKHLPVYKNLRVAARFTLVAGIFCCALIGVAVEEWGAPALARWRALAPRRRLAAAGVLALAAAYLVDAASWNRLQFLPTFGAAPPREPPAAEFHQVPGDRGRMMVYPRANLGTLSCFEETPLDISPRLRGDLPADEYLADPAAGSVRRLLWSPNRIVLEVDARRPTTVLVNQNMGTGWRAEGAALVEKGEDGLLAARVDAGHHVVTFRYLPRSVLAGAAVSLLAAAGALAFLLSERRRRRLSAAAPASVASR